MENVIAGAGKSSRYQGILDDEKVTVVAGHTPVACVPEALDAGRALNPAWSAAASS